MNDSLDSYLCAGYFLVRMSPRPAGVSSLVPPAILTVSNCIASTLPAWWAFGAARIDEEKRMTFLKACGLQTRSQELLRWVADREEQHQVLYPNVFGRLATAREFVAHFAIDTGIWRLVGLGLADTLRESFLDELAPAKKDDWLEPFCKLLLSDREFESGAKIVGYDVLGFDPGTVHSWLCNGLETRAHSFGIHVNALGLLETHADAAKIAEDANDPETGAEQVPWFPFVVVEYSTP